MATAYSPTVGQLGRRTWRPEGRLSACTLMTARSVSGSRPTMVAVELLAGGQGHLDGGDRVAGGLVGDHVVVGDDHAVGAVDHARAFGRVLLRCLLPEPVAAAVVVPVTLMLTTLGPRILATDCGRARPRPGPARWAWSCRWWRLPWSLARPWSRCAHGRRRGRRRLSVAMVGAPQRAAAGADQHADDDDHDHGHRQTARASEQRVDSGPVDLLDLSVPMSIPPGRTC